MSALMQVTAVTFKRVRFISIPAPDARILAQFGEPLDCISVLEDISDLKAGEWPGDLEAPPIDTAAGPDFDCAIVTPSAAQEKLETRALTWLDAKEPFANSVRMELDKSGKSWVLCRPGRAVVCAEPKQVEGLLTALAEFFLLERELTKLETEINANWKQAESDLPLASDVKSEDLKRQAELSATTRALWMRRIRLSRIERPLGKTALTLPPEGRRLASKLRRAFDVESRAEILDGQIEVFEYIYEMANQRMGEYSNFRHGFIIEVLIVVLLALEVAVMIWEFVHHYEL